MNDIVELNKSKLSTNLDQILHNHGSRTKRARLRGKRMWSTHSILLLGINYFRSGVSDKKETNKRKEETRAYHLYSRG